MKSRQQPAVPSEEQARPKLPKLKVIDELVPEILARLGENTISGIYRDRIRPDRTRRYELPAPAASSRPVRIEIMHTLLGIELKIGRRRLMCPDLSTARYLSVFARLGVTTVAVPYDITRVARLADDLESAWFRMQMLAEDLLGEAGDRRLTRLIRQLIGREREEVEAIGPGPVAPRFNR
jgi:hypothetical protein